MFLNHFGSAQPVVLVLLLLRQETEGICCRLVHLFLSPHPTLGPPTLGDFLVSRFMMHVTLSTEVEDCWPKVRKPIGWGSLCYCSHATQRQSHFGLNNSFLWRAVLCVVASLASTYSMPVAPSHTVVIIKNDCRY